MPFKINSQKSIDTLLKIFKYYPKNIIDLMNDNLDIEFINENNEIIVKNTNYCVVILALQSCQKITIDIVKLIQIFKNCEDYLNFILVNPSNIQKFLYSFYNYIDYFEKSINNANPVEYNELLFKSFIQLIHYKQKWLEFKYYKSDTRFVDYNNLIDYLNNNDIKKLRNLSNNQKTIKFIIYSNKIVKKIDSSILRIRNWIEIYGFVIEKLFNKIFYDAQSLWEKENFTKEQIYNDFNSIIIDYCEYNKNNAILPLPNRFKSFIDNILSTYIDFKTPYIPLDWVKGKNLGDYITTYYNECFDLLENDNINVSSELYYGNFKD